MALPKVWEALTEVQEALSVVGEGSGGPPTGSGEVGRPSSMSGMGRKAISDVQALSGGPIRGPGGVGSPYRRSSEKRRGPRTEPWGTPEVTTASSEQLSSMAVHWCRSLR